jgi:glucose-6-phosphate 1-dehydrogenase
VGQYVGPGRALRMRSYAEETKVAAGSLTPTYAATRLRIHNARWEGVPFFMEAGKAVDSRLTEIRVRFRNVSSRLAQDLGLTLPPNQLVIRIQPDEAIYLRIVNKVPGLTLAVQPSELNLRYQAAFKALIPDAYECLLLDVLKGDKSLFIRVDELAAAWDIFTPVLHDMERLGIAPDRYEAGGAGPLRARTLEAVAPGTVAEGVAPT